MEKSFKKEIEMLRLGNGQVFHGEGILAITKGLPQSAALIRWDRRRQQAGKSALALPLKLPAHTFSGFLILRTLASLKWLRRRGSRFTIEQSVIERWLVGVEQGTRSHWQLSHEIVLCNALDHALVKHGAPARPVKAQPLMWVKKRPGQAA